MTPSSQSALRGPAVRAVLSAALTHLCLFALCASSAFGYALYGYEDEYGIVHLNEKPVSERHVLLYEGDEDPKLGFAAIKKLIREKGGADEKRRKDWIAETVRFFGPIANGGAGFANFPKTIRTGPVVDLIKKYGERYGVDPWLVYAVVEQESGFLNGAVSGKGAQGLMQLMPDTQRTFGVDDPFDPASNIETGVRFLKNMLVKYKDQRLALAAYNAGPGVVDKYAGAPPFPETSLYVDRVMYRHAMLKELAAEKAAKSGKPAKSAKSAKSGRTGKGKNAPPQGK